MTSSPLFRMASRVKYNPSIPPTVTIISFAGLYSILYCNLYLEDIISLNSNNPALGEYLVRPSSIALQPASFILLCGCISGSPNVKSITLSYFWAKLNRRLVKEGDIEFVISDNCIILFLYNLEDILDFIFT